jgi:hypothetical protein
MVSFYPKSVTISSKGYLLQNSDRAFMTDCIAISLADLAIPLLFQMDLQTTQSSAL